MIDSVVSVYSYCYYYLLLLQQLYLLLRRAVMILYTNFVCVFLYYYYDWLNSHTFIFYYYHTIVRGSWMMMRQFIIAPSPRIHRHTWSEHYTDSHDDRRFQPSLHGKNNETPTFDHLGYPLGDYEDPYTVASTYVKLHHIPHGNINRPSQHREILSSG